MTEEEAAECMAGYEAALLIEAREFLETFGPAFAVELPTAEELKADFLHRL